MDAQTLRVSRIAGGSKDIERPRDAAVPVVRVLERDRGRDRLVRIVPRPHRLHDLLRRHHAGLGWHRSDLDAANGCRTRRLVVEDVRVGVGDQLLTAVRVDGDSDQVAHRAAGHERGGLLAHPLGGDLHQPVGRGVVTENVVAQWRLDHRQAHLGTGHGHGVGAEIDRCHPINLAR